MTYRDWDRASSKTSYKRRWEASQWALKRAQRENRVRGKCLSIAIEALEHYDRLGLAIPKKALAQINERLAELEPEEEGNDAT
jgi:hypothetical protein